MRRLLALVVVLMSVNAGQACNIPVFRYALERWRPDLYQVYVFHKGELTKEQTALVKSLDAYGPTSKVVSNLETTLVNLDKATKEEKKVYGSAGEMPLPCLVVQTTNLDRETVTIWAGKLEKQSIDALVTSPVRQEVAKRLQAGETTVWMFLECGNKELDDKQFALLEKELAKQAKLLKLPKLTDNPEDKLAEGPPLKIAFSIVRIKREEVAEAVTQAMLLKSEEDIAHRKEPMAFPIFGRGRTLGGLIGAGITEENISGMSGMIVAPCSCKFKFQSPGYDLLISTNWEMIFDKKK